uniref:Uncharacterized protein n=2 Tax=Oreochromis TaxID=8139 RepID=A0A669DUQ8_ORENI
MQDNAPSHASKYSTAWLARKGIKEEKLITCSSQSRGVAILIHKQLQFKCTRMVKDEDGRTLLLLAEIQGHRMILSNIYAPNIDDPTFFGNKISDMGDYPILMAGDFSLVMDDILDQSTPSHARTNSIYIIHASLRQHH